MSGGSANYLYSKIANDLTDYEAPSGHYGIGAEINKSYDKDVHTWRELNPMHDRELSEMMYDVSCLLHSLEWYDSYDTSQDCYKADVKAFKHKWCNRKPADRCESYKEDIQHMVQELADDLRSMVQELAEEMVV